MAKGFVYVLSNRAMPGLLKIGFSQQVPEVRAGELFTTGVPEPFSVEYYCLTDAADEIELTLHEMLKEQRPRDDREFFQADVPAVRAMIEQLCRPEVSWAKPFTVSGQPGSGRTCAKCGTTYYFRENCARCGCALSGSAESSKSSETMPLRRPSAKLAQIVGAQSLTRGDAAKRVWAYIQQRGLQDEMDRRWVNLGSDPILHDVFGAERLTLFALSQALAGHLS